MSADEINLADCSHCRSAGSIRNGRCDICEWEAERPRPVEGLRGIELPTSSGDRGTLSRTSG